MTPRLATPDDAPAIAALHVRAWKETYPGLLPPAEFALRNYDMRLALWTDILSRGMMVSYLPQIGFAQIGQNRDKVWAQTYPRELYSFYTLQPAHGTGAAQALLRHAIGDSFQPFTAEVLKGNARATGFYERIGGQRIMETREVLHGWDITNVLFGWMYPVQLTN